MASTALLALRGQNVFADGINVGHPMTGAKVPMPVETGDSVTFGGSRGAIEIMNSMEAPEIMFSTKGMQPELLAQMGLGFGMRRTYTVVGALVDELAEDATRRVVPVTATAVGRLSNGDIEKYEGGNLVGTEFTVKSILRYSLTIGSVLVCRYELKLGGWMDLGGLQGEIASAIGLNA